MSGSSTPSKATGTPSTSKGVGFFNHYPKYFLQPYGAADEAPSSDTIFRRTNSMNCEMLTRPAIQFSEVAETFADNLAIVSESPLLSKRAKGYVAEVTKLGEMLSKSSLKDAEQPPSNDDAKNMMPGFMEKSSIEQFMRSAFTLGSALFSMGCSYLVTQAYLRNPSVLADKFSMARGEDTSFKAWQKLSGYRDIILAGHKCEHGSQTPVHSGPAIRNLLLQLSSSDDEDEPPRKVAKKPCKNKHNHCHQMMTVTDTATKHQKDTVTHSIHKI